MCCKSQASPTKARIGDMMYTNRPSPASRATSTSAFAKLSILVLYPIHPSSTRIPSGTAAPSPDSTIPATGYAQ